MQDFPIELTVLPLRAIAFQCILLMVAIALEGAVLRQQLRLGYQPSMQYAATINLLATSLGWLLFLGIEPLVPVTLKTQIISYIFFDRFFDNIWLTGSRLPILILLVGIFSFFATFWVKVKGLEVLMQMTGQWSKMFPQREGTIARQARYEMARQGQSTQQSPRQQSLAVLQANALSFSAILLLLLLRHGLERLG